MREPSYLLLPPPRGRIKREGGFLTDVLPGLLFTEIGTSSFLAKTFENLLPLK
jgi:hypothetical protein